jgi:hypothetical protein
MMSQHAERLAILGLGGLVGLAIAFPIANYLSVNTPAQIVERVTDYSMKPMFQDMGMGAFGTLSPSTPPQGLGGTAMSESTLSADSKVSADMSIRVGEPYPGGITYDYTYIGEAIDLAAYPATVYRRSTERLDLRGAGNDLARANLGPVDLGRFNGLQLQSFAVSQEDKNGYSVYVDALYGQLSINGNEGHWQTSGEYVALTNADIVPDAELLNIANAFIDTYGIDTSNYGAPVVDKRGVVFALSQPADQQYIPDVVNVVYPLLLDGQPSYASDGSPYGLNVMVNMRTKLVSGANMGLSEGFERSAYAIETDATRILGVAEAGGLYNYNYGDSATVIPIELGTPTFVLMNHYHYNGTTSDILFVPALSFPIVKNSDTNPLYQQAVVVPLVKDILDQAGQEPVYRILEEDLQSE